MAGLSMLEKSAFRDLQDHYLLSYPGSLPAEYSRLYRMCGAKNKHETAAVRYVIELFFVLRDGRYTSEMLDERANSIISHSRKQAERASKTSVQSPSKNADGGPWNSSNQLENKDSPEAAAEPPLISYTTTVVREEEYKISSHHTLPREDKKIDPPNELQSCNTVAKIQQVVTECFPNILSGGVVIEEWIRQGADPDLDIIPTIRDLALKKGPSLRSISYLTPCVAQAKQARETTKKTFGETHHAKTFERPQVAQRRPSATELQRRLREQYGPNLDGNQPDRREPIDVTRSEALGEIGGFAT